MLILYRCDRVYCNPARKGLIFFSTIFMAYFVYRYFFIVWGEDGQLYWCQADETFDSDAITAIDNAYFNGNGREIRQIFHQNSRKVVLVLT